MKLWKRVRNWPILRRIKSGIIVALILVLCLGIVTFALVAASLELVNNVFVSGRIKINLNDGEPIITEDEYLFEPGMTVVKDFFIQNDSTWAVWYRIYFKDIEGELSDYLLVTIKDGSDVLYTGTAATMSRSNIGAADNYLAVGERKTLTIVFHMPKDVGNEAQKDELSFVVVADAVQAKNNPNKLFE